MFNCSILTIIFCHGLKNDENNKIFTQTRMIYECFFNHAKLDCHAVNYAISPNFFVVFFLLITHVLQRTVLQLEEKITLKNLCLKSLV